METQIDRNKAGQEASEFLSLPPELRIMVYTLYFQEVRFDAPFPQRSIPRETTAALLRTSRLIHAEALPILYGVLTVTLYCKNFTSKPHLLTSKPHFLALNLIQSVSIRYGLMDHIILNSSFLRQMNNSLPKLKSLTVPRNGLHYYEPRIMQILLGLISTFASRDEYAGIRMILNVRVDPPILEDCDRDKPAAPQNTINDYVSLFPKVRTFTFEGKLKHVEADALRELAKSPKGFKVVRWEKSDDPDTVIFWDDYEVEFVSGLDQDQAA